MASDGEDKYETDQLIQTGKKIPYDPLWKGPVQNIRSSTDRIWLIVFCIYLIIYIGCAAYGFYAGNVRKLTYPSDSAGRTCGIDKSVADKPYRLYLNLNKCTPSDNETLSICQLSSVCLSECPTTNFIYSRSEELDQLKEKLICTPDVNLTLYTTHQDIEVLINNDKCTRWYLASKPVFKNCIANNTWKGHENETITEEKLAQINNNIDGGERFLKKAYSIVTLALGPASVSILLGGVFTLIYVVLLKWLAIPFFYATICMFIVIIGAVIYYLGVAYAKTNENGLLAGLILCILLVVGIIIAIIYLRKKIYLACQLVKESSKAVMQISSTLIFPIIPLTLYLVVVILTGMFALSLTTITAPNYTIEILEGNEACQCKDAPIASYYTGLPCKPEEFNMQCSTYDGKTCKFMTCRLDGESSPGYVNFFHFVNAFGFYWLVFFISGLEFMVLGGTFATWYWTHNKDSVGSYTLIESISRTTRFHLGTIAVGSLILAVARIIRMILKGIHDQLKDTDHAAAKAVMCCCRALFDLLESFLSFININAYIMCAIHGKSFCQSAKNAFNLIMRNVVKVIVVDSVADWLFFMAKLLITSIIAAGLGLYLHYTQSSEASENSSPILAVAMTLTIIGTFIISSVFFKVQSVAVSTIFLCFIEDTERNDGSDERPYYMSDKLEKLLHK